MVDVHLTVSGGESVPLSVSESPGVSLDLGVPFIGGRLPDYTGPTTVTVSKPLLLAVFHGAFPGTGSINFPFDGIQPLATGFLDESTNGVYVYNDGYFTISGVDYDE